MKTMKAMIALLTLTGCAGVGPVNRRLCPAEKCTFTKWRPRSDKRGVDMISGSLPFGRLWYGKPDGISNAIGYAKFFSRSHDAVIRVYDEAWNVIETYEQAARLRHLRDIAPNYSSVGLK